MIDRHNVVNSDVCDFLNVKTLYSTFGLRDVKKVIKVIEKQSAVITIEEVRDYYVNDDCDVIEETFSSI